MAEWVLVLSIVFSHTAGVGAAIESVPGFATEAECQAAGKQWTEDVASYRAAQHSAICLRRSLISASVKSDPPG